MAFKLRTAFISLLVVTAFILSALVPVYAATLYEYLESGQDGDSSEIYGANWAAQGFTVGSTSHTATSVQLYLKRTGNDWGTMTISIKNADSNEWPETSELELAAATLTDYTEIDTSYNWYSFDLDVPVTFEATEKYAIVVRVSGGSATDYVEWGADTGGGLADAQGAVSSDGGSSWADDSTSDYLFRVYGEEAIEVIDGAVISGFRETGDLLFLIHYNNIYPPYYDTYDVGSYFSLQLVYTDNSTVLATQNCPAWGYRPGSIYLSADVAATIDDDITGYYIKLYGTFTGNPTASLTLAADDWLGTDLNKLDSWVLETAANIGTYAGVSLLSSVSGQTILNSAGAQIFEQGIPGLLSIRPGLFSEGVTYPGYTEPTYTNAFDDTTYEDMLGTEAVDTAEDMSNIIGLDAKTSIALAFLALYVGVGGFAFAKGHATAGFLLAYPFILGGAIARVIDIQWILVSSILATLGAVASFWWWKA